MKIIVLVAVVFIYLCISIAYLIKIDREHAKLYKRYRRDPLSLTLEEKELMEFLCIKWQFLSNIFVGINAFIAILISTIAMCRNYFATT
jgi:hypothetical protein